MSSEEEEEEYEFLCPECGESLAVNDSMRESLTERGCVICGTSVTVDAFTILPAEDSS